MVAAADFLHEPALYKQTFSMSNICPQAPFLNRGLWSRFEAWIRLYLLRFIFEEMLVVTGPVFAPIFINNQWIYLHRTIGDFPNLITVPSHFFKVIIGRQKGLKTTVIAAFLVPNNNTVGKTVSRFKPLKLDNNLLYSLLGSSGELFSQARTTGKPK